MLPKRLINSFQLKIHVMIDVDNVYSRTDKNSNSLKVLKIADFLYYLVKF